MNWNEGKCAINVLVLLI